LAQSLNTASIRLMQQSGGPRGVASLAKRLGIADTLPADLSLALGTGEVGLLELSAAYATVFNGGHLVTPMGIDSLDADGKRVPFAHYGGERVLEPEIAANMTRMLAGVVSHGSGHAADVPGRFVAGKTGTTQDFRDAWFVGAYGSGPGAVVIGVWMGNDDGRPMKNVSGSGLPARLFHEVALGVY